MVTSTCSEVEAAWLIKMGIIIFLCTASMCSAVNVLLLYVV